MELNRRELLAKAAVTGGALTLTPAFLRQALAAAAPAQPGASPYGPLLPPDANGLALPAGFRSRIVARALQRVEGTSYVWPIFPDGQATYATGDGGWILVTNSESLSFVGAGTSAIRFSKDGEIVDAYRILDNTNTNCAGGPTPARSRRCFASRAPTIGSRRSAGWSSTRRGTRMYCTSQRAFSGVGAVYEIAGPFRLPSGGVPPDFVYGPPAGEARPSGPLNPGPDRQKPRLSVRVKQKKRVRRKSLRQRGLRLTVATNEAATAYAVLDTHALETRPGNGGSTARPKNITLARTETRIERGGADNELVLRLSKRGRRKLRRDPTGVPARVLLSVVDGAGNESVYAKRVRIGQA